jgi:hypothetical protein
LWGDPSSWTELLVALRAFHDRWTAPARAAGWSDVHLFGLDPVAPRAKLQHTGGAFLACRPDSQTIAVDNTAITLVVRTSSRMRVYKPADGGVLAWELVRASTAAQNKP